MQLVMGKHTHTIEFDDGEKWSLCEDCYIKAKEKKWHHAEKIDYVEAKLER